MDKKPEKLVPEVRFKGFTDDWEQRELGEVAKVTMGQSPSSKNYTDNPNDYVLVQGNADLKSNEISPRVWTKEVTKQVH
ncbi:restriction endonuclease subunit S, partial [Limosilactobacillus reuteri]